MANLLKFRRGSTASHATFSGAQAEVTVDTTKNTLVVHDGLTFGGFPLVNAADLAVPDGAALVGGVNPIYVLKNHRQPGDSDSVVINKALRKIELDALAGSTLQLECGRTYTFDSEHILGYINDLDIDLNGALLMRAHHSVVSGALSQVLGTTGEAGKSLKLASIPANWSVADLLYIAMGDGGYANTTQKTRITAIDRATNTVTVNVRLTGISGVTSYPVGTLVTKSYSCFAGRPSSDDPDGPLTAGTNKRIRIHGGTIDGNVSGQNSFAWTVNNTILLHTEGGAIYDMKLQNTSSECIVGHGVRVEGCTFLDLGGSAMHTSVNDQTVATSTPTIFTTNLVRRANKKGNTLSGHSEGVITFSWGPGHTIISDNFIDGSAEAMLGNFGVQTGTNPSMMLTVSGNLVRNCAKIFAALQADTYGVNVQGNSFHNCGDNSGMAVLLSPANIVNANASSGGTIMPLSNMTVSGTFTPTLRGSASVGATVYTAQTGSYVVSGGFCHFSFSMATTSTTATGNTQFDGMPLPARASGGLNPVNIFQVTGPNPGAGKTRCAIIGQNARIVQLREINLASGAIENTNPIQNVNEYYVSGSYPV